MPETATAQEVRSGPNIQRMFSAIAPRYDLLNHLLSLNRDKSWRRRAVELLLAGGRPEARYLDACAGTLDLAVEIAERPASTARSSPRISVCRCSRPESPSRRARHSHGLWGRAAAAVPRRIIRWSDRRLWRAQPVIH
jgi:hypothetical protein